MDDKNKEINELKIRIEELIKDGKIEKEKEQKENIEQEVKYNDLNTKLNNLQKDYDIVLLELKLKKEENENLHSLNETNKKYTRMLIEYEEKERELESERKK